MTKIKTTRINDFDGGITRDLRVQSPNKYKLTQNFDTFSDKKRLQPFRALEANETKNINIVKFIQANSQIYGFGTTAGASVGKIYKKSDGSNLITSSWVEDANIEGSGARNSNVFFLYKNYLYFWENAGLARHGDITVADISKTNSAVADMTFSYTNVAQPIHHKADDMAYFFSDNKVHKYNGGTDAWTVDALELPDDLIITCASEYGNYLAIGCKSKETVGKSFVFLWDRDSSVTTISEKIDWGFGDLKILAVLDDILVGISNVSTGVFGIKDKIHIKGYSGSLSFI